MTALSTLFAVSVLGGALVPLLVVVGYHKSIDLAKDLSSPAWDFSRSWATNLTAIGTVLGYSAILSSFPATAKLHNFERPVYLTVGALATAIAAAAPVIFNMCKATMKAFDLKVASSLAFLLSTAFTVAGVMLQLQLGVSLLSELQLAGYLPSWVSLGLRYVVRALSIGLLFYAVLTAHDVLAKAEPKETDELRFQVVGTREKGSWSLL